MESGEYNTGYKKLWKVRTLLLLVMMTMLCLSAHRSFALTLLLSLYLSVAVETEAGLHYRRLSDGEETVCIARGGH